MNMTARRSLWVIRCLACGSVRECDPPYAVGALLDQPWSRERVSMTTLSSCHDLCLFSDAPPLSSR